VSSSLTDHPLSSGRPRDQLRVRCRWRVQDAAVEDATKEGVACVTAVEPVAELVEVLPSSVSTAGHPRTDSSPLRLAKDSEEDDPGGRLPLTGSRWLLAYGSQPAAPATPLSSFSYTTSRDANPAQGDRRGAVETETSRTAR
jgi:hypothetical protein